MRKLVLAVGAALALAACSKSFPEPVLPEPLPEPSDPWEVEEITSLRQGRPVDGSLRAGFGTKSHLDGTSVVWTAGDEFTMYYYDSEGKTFYSSVLTTDGGGAPATFHYSTDLPSGTCYAVYPAPFKRGVYQGNVAFGVRIPPVQTATAGSVCEGANPSFATAATQGDDLNFENIPALIRFRLSGDIVGSVRSVTFRATQTIAGDAVLIADGGSPDISYEIYFSGQEFSRSVTLEGDFVAGEEYYIAIAPCTLSGFTMVFSDDAGHTTTKVSTRDVTFNRSRITDFQTINLGASFTDAARDYSPVKYMSATKGTKPATIAVIPEGFRDFEMDDYVILASSGIDALFATEPFKSYRDYFNVYFLKVASNDSGANITDGNGNITTARDCYFGSKWGLTSYSDMRANDNKVFDFVSANCPDITGGIHTIYEVPILMIINDTRYGGICWTWDTGKGYCMAPYSRAGGRLGWAYPSTRAVSDTDPSLGTTTVSDAEKTEVGSNTGDWRNTLVHEFGGHCFSRLGDEYWYESDRGAVASISSHSWSVPFGLNVSASAIDVPWQELLDRQAALVSADPHYSRIGIFQGADVSILNRWRSERVSCMIDNRFYFSAWQRALIVQRIFSLTGDVFDLDTFLASDVTEDPVRDIAASPSRGIDQLIPVHMMPPGAPPVLVHE